MTSNKPIWDEEGSIGYAWDDLAVPFEAPIWQEDILPRVREALRRVAYTDGSLMFGIYTGFFDDLPDIDEDQLRSLPDMPAEAIRSEMEDGNLEALAEELSKLVQAHYQTVGEKRDYLSLHIHEMPV